VIEQWFRVDQVAAQAAETVASLPAQHKKIQCFFVWGTCQAFAGSVLDVI